MTDKEIGKMIDVIGDYILKEFEKQEASVAEALTVLEAVTEQIITSLCDVIEEDAEEMLDVFCNGIQQSKQKKRTYTTGDERGDEIIAKIVAEMKAGGDLEEIIDKYVSCDSQELRQQLLEGMKRIRDNHQIDNVEIGYNK